MSKTCGRGLCAKDCARVLKKEYGYDNTATPGYGTPEYRRVPPFWSWLTACECGTATQGDRYQFWSRLFSGNDDDIVCERFYRAYSIDELYQQYGLSRDGAG